MKLVDKNFKHIRAFKNTPHVRSSSNEKDKRQLIVIRRSNRRGTRGQNIFTIVRHC